jgi:hypothetical protein
MKGALIFVEVRTQSPTYLISKRGTGWNIQDTSRRKGVRLERYTGTRCDLARARLA